MTLEEKKEAVAALAGEDAEKMGELLALYLRIAGEMILSKLYPVKRPDSADVPAAHEMLQCELASELFLRRGDEGEVIHIENGIHRHYESAASDELLKSVTPYAGVIL